MPALLRTPAAADLLASLPLLLGSTPVRGLVVVAFVRGRPVGAVRDDLPAPDAVDEVAATCIGRVCRITDADATAVVVWTGAAATDPPAHDELVRALAQRADACGLRVREALWVAADAWGSYLDADCPPGGYALPPAPTRSGSAGTPTLPEPAGTPTLPEPAGTPATIGAAPCADTTPAATARALDALDAAIAAVCGIRPSTADDPPVDPRALGAACRLDDLPRLYEHVLHADPATLDPFTAALLIWALDRPGTRDVALVQWCGDRAAGAAALDAQLRWEAGEDYPPELGERMWGDGPRPDPARVRAALRLCRRAAARAPGTRRAGALAVCAWMSWALGRPGDADAYARRATAHEAEHGLAEIVRSFVEVGYRPGWAAAT